MGEALQINHGSNLETISSMHWRRRWHPTPVLLPGKSHGWRSLVGCSPWGREESDTTERLHFHFSLSCIGEGNGTPLQCSCLENPRDGGAWKAAVHGVAKSRIRLHFHFQFSLSCIGDRNGHPLQCSCLENPRDGGAWWAAVYGVAQSRTRLKRLSSSSSSSMHCGFTAVVYMKRAALLKTLSSTNGRSRTLSRKSHSKCFTKKKYNRLIQTY